MPGRGNGLEATRYVPLVDIDPQLVDAVLAALRTEGVAAYVVPAPGVMGPYLDVQLPNRPTDRLWVDADAQTRARAVLQAHLPAMRDELAEAATDARDDDAFAAIVAGFDAPPEGAVPPWPVSEDLEPAGAETAQDEAPEPWTQTVTEPARSRREPDPDHDRYVPPPPPPVPRGDTITRFAWAGLIGGPVYLLLITLLSWEPGLTGLVALAAFVGGFVTLVARMPDKPPHDSGPDDGAVV